MSPISSVVSRPVAQRRKIRPYGFIEATHRKQFDDLVRLAVTICQAPTALIALEEHGHYRVVAHVGLEAPGQDGRPFYRRVAEAGEFVVTPGQAGRQLMAGVPLLGYDGHTVGCLCVMDTVARELTPEQIESLWALSRQAVAQVELRRSLTKLARACAGQTRAEKELASERNLLRAVIDSVPDNLYLKDTEGRYILDNNAHVRFLGKRHSTEIIGKTVFDFFPPEQASKFDADDKAVLQWGQALLNLEEEAVDQAGLRHDLLTSKIPLRDEAGDIVGLICISHDITGRKQEERSLAQLAAIVEDSADAIYSKTIDGIILTWNAAAERMYGYTAAEIVGRYIGLLSPPDRIDEVQRIQQLLTQGQRVTTFDTERVRKDGSRIDLSVTVSPLRDALGTITGASVVARDITDRKRAARALRESEERFRLMVDGVKDYAIVMLHERGHITGWNAGAQRIFGYTAEEVLGESVAQFYCPEDVTAGRPAEDLVLATRQGRYECEGWRVRQNGTRFFAHIVTTAILDDDGNRRWFAQVTRDITELNLKTEALEESNRMLTQTLDELHRTQKELVQTERLRALGQMASGIAHDFNNALAPIIGFSELLLVRPESLRDTEHVARYLALIHDNAGAAARVVTRLREFYRYRDEAEELQAFDLNEIVKQVIETTRPKWKNEALAAGVTIQMKTDLTPLPFITGEAADLRNALTGVVMNAIDALLQKQRPGQIDWSTRVEGEHVVISINDTGIGMSEEVRQHCFEPFFSTKSAHGSGFGLALAYGVVQRHAGMIAIESEAGLGTTVTIRLPLSVARDPIAPEPIAVSEIRPLRILIVDDEATVREVTTAYLLEDHHQVEQAASGMEALEKLNTTPFDLVITDKAMPGMSGPQLATAIKQGHPGIPVLLITGFGDMMNAVGEIPANVDEVLGKPLTMEQLRQAVAKYCQVTR